MAYFLFLLVLVLLVLLVFLPYFCIHFYRIFIGSFNYSYQLMVPLRKENIKYPIVHLTTTAVSQTWCRIPPNWRNNQPLWCCQCKGY